MPPEVRPLIAMAQAMTCVELRDALTAESEGQMCAQGIFSVTRRRMSSTSSRRRSDGAGARQNDSISLGMCLVEMQSTSSPSGGPSEDQNDEADRI